jgi:hypothetical protein
VWLDNWGNRRLAEALSDAKGRFRLGPVEPVYRHCFSISIKANGFARQYIRDQSYSIFPGIDNDLGRIGIDPGRVFSGQVFDMDGQPCRGVDVRCNVFRNALGHTVGDIEPEYCVTSDSEGRYQTHPVPVGKLGVGLIVPERRLAWIVRPVQPGGEEVLQPLHLKKAAPIQGIVTDENGNPVAGAKINANAEYRTVSDSEGRFTIHGFGANSHFQFQLPREGYVFVNWGVNVRDDGIRWFMVGDDARKEYGPFQELSVVLTPVAWIEGRAVDAETDEPVRLERVVLCSFDRKANGEIVLSGCRSLDFEQPEVGRFRIPYTYPDEYHLTLSADGYHDAEAFTPKVTELKLIERIIVKLKKKREGSASDSPKQTISGAVTRNGKPVKAGWAALWRMPRCPNAINAWILRGRTVVGDPICYSSVLIQNGTYVLNVPYQHDAWYVVIEEHGHALTQVGPIKIGVNEKRQLDIACTERGSIRGRVKNVPAGWEGHLWAVAFTKTAIQAESRVSSAGEFCFQQLPPGEYGLKVGHDAYQDSEVPQTSPHSSEEEWQELSKEEWQKLADKEADPWQRAKVVTVEAGRELSGVELELPP